jgi:tRNA threonylcarbamoyladenosine biosynthesis protein TsaB
MILLLDSSTNVCDILLIKGDSRIDEKWQSDRQLAKDLLSRIKKILTDNELDWGDISGIGVFKGPGSFTGLRIGITVLNTLSDSLNIPIVGTTGKDWADAAINRLNNNENDKIVLPYYGSDAKITTPKK